MSSTASRSATPLAPFWQLLGLSAFALLQPFLGVLAEYTEFLVAHDATVGDLFWLVAILLLAPPLILFGLEWLAGRAGSRVGTAVHLVFLALLTAAVVLPIVHRVGVRPGWLAVIVALAAGVAADELYRRQVVVRTYLGWTALAVPVFLVAFFANPTVKKLVFPGQIERFSVRHDSDLPVVLVVFDALPTYSLMDENRMIDRGRYPNLRALADAGIWYRGATTVSEATVVAIPALLSGRDPVPGQKPILVDHPQNLFTILQESHDMFVYESHTALCPPDARSRPRTGSWRRVGSLLSDTLVVILHVVLPADLRSRLPDISGSWRDFSRGDGPGSAAPAARRWEGFEEFLESITPRKDPSLHFVHVFCPHEPYMFFPSGKMYWEADKEPSGEGRQFDLWSEDAVAVRQSHQRYLLQLGYVDHLVGTIVQRLQKAGIYDRALIVITADHGTSFRPGKNRRRLDDANNGDVLCVPVIMKYPGVAAGSVDDGFFSLTDILPTMLNVMQLEPSGPVDGRSALGKDRRVSAEVSFVGETVGQYPLPLVHATRDESARDQLHVFGAGDFDRVFQFGEYGSLVGRRPEDLRIQGQSDLTVTLEEPEQLLDVALDARMLPASLSGALHIGPGADQEPVLAVAVNDVIAGVTRPYRKYLESRIKGWGMLLPPDVLRQGKNQVSFFVVSGPPADPILTAVGSQSARISYLDEVLGGRLVPGVLEEGFDIDEQLDWDGVPVRWTFGQAVLTVPVDGDAFPQALDVALASAGPHGGTLRVLVNGHEVANGAAPSGRWNAHLSLAGVPEGRAARIELHSSTFVPAETTPGATDRRVLGVAVESVVLRAHLDPARLSTLSTVAGVNVGPAPPAAVVVDGVYGLEDWAGVPVRWTRGAATWTVPMPAGARPDTLLIDLADTGPAGTHLTIQVDDHVVFSGPVPRGAWGRRLPLTGVTPRARLTIEIRSGTFVPAGGRDSRTLGVAVRQLVLSP